MKNRYIFGIFLSESLVLIIDQFFWFIAKRNPKPIVMLELYKKVQ